MKKYKAKANANIALIKYWGKENEELIIPNTSSLSFTLDALYTETKVSFVEGETDVFYLDDTLQGEKETKKISKFIDRFRDLAKSQKRVLVESYNHVPTAAGLASSASGYAALSLALDKLFGLNLSEKDLSIMTRKGSGSATRSIYGGIVEWKKGHDDKSSYAIKVDKGDWDLAMVIIVVNKNRKAISSREAMKETVATSPLYKAYTDQSQIDLDNIKKAIAEKNFEEMGKIAEHNAMQMHATILSTNPPIIYFEEESIKAINKVKELRANGYPAYFTMDAGPNVKIITRKSKAQEIVDFLDSDFDRERLIISDIALDDPKVEEIEE